MTPSSDFQTFPFQAFSVLDRNKSEPGDEPELSGRARLVHGRSSAASHQAEASRPLTSRSEHSPEFGTRLGSPQSSAGFQAQEFSQAREQKQTWNLPRHDAASLSQVQRQYSGNATESFPSGDESEPTAPGSKARAEHERVDGDAVVDQWRPGLQPHEPRASTPKHGGSACDPVRHGRRSADFPGVWGNQEVAVGLKASDVSGCADTQTHLCCAESRAGSSVGRRGVKGHEQATTASCRYGAAPVQCGPTASSQGHHFPKPSRRGLRDQSQDCEARPAAAEKGWKEGDPQPGSQYLKLGRKEGVDETQACQR